MMLIGSMKRCCLREVQTSFALCSACVFYSYLIVIVDLLFLHVKYILFELRLCQMYDPLQVREASELTQITPSSGSRLLILRCLLGKIPDKDMKQLFPTSRQLVCLTRHTLKSAVKNNSIAPISSFLQNAGSGGRKRRLVPNQE